MRNRNVVLIELGMILGIFLSIFLVPRNLSIHTFVLIAGSIFVAANILLLGSRKQATPSGRYRMTGRAYLALGLMVLYWVLHFLWR
jgi:ABC-type Fe3+-siderophore transport system permease subunit